MNAVLGLRLCRSLRQDGGAGLFLTPPPAAAKPEEIPDQQPYRNGNAGGYYCTDDDPRFSHSGANLSVIARVGCTTLGLTWEGRQVGRLTCWP